MDNESAKTNIVILDRGYDLNSILVHDFHYESLVRDQLGTNGN